MSALTQALVWTKVEILDKPDNNPIVNVTVVAYVSCRNFYNGSRQLWLEIQNYSDDPIETLWQLIGMSTN